MRFWTLLWSCWVCHLAEGAPFPSQVKGCITGQECQISLLQGTGLGNGDRIALHSIMCGPGAKVEGMPGTIGMSLQAENQGQDYKWSGKITPDGGEYRMCYCSVLSDCTSLTNFQDDAGTMTITGPRGGMIETCISGQSCSVSDISGVYLRNDDSMMVLASCGVSPGIDGFPNGAKATSGTLGGTEHGWGQTRIRAHGGTYSICWCAFGQTCVEGIHHLKQLGTLTVVGPHGGFFKACLVFDTCDWSGLTGEGLQNGDRIMLLEECGAGVPVAGFPNGDIAVATNTGSSYDFPGSDNVVKAGGHEYEMCWCAQATSVCSSPANFLVSAGILKIVGPRSDNVVSCVQGRSCHFEIEGVGLTNTDKIQILDICATGVGPGGFPNFGLATATNFGRSYESWTGAVQAQFGAYRLCWCGNGWSCPPVSGFKMDAGILWVVGITANQQRYCQNQDGCSISGITGHNLQNGDRMKILTVCDGTGENVTGWPLHGLSLPATADGTAFSWGILARVTAVPGNYRMCWCPRGNSNGCADTADFLIDAGTLTLTGPVILSRNGSCSAQQMPNCVVGPFNNGVGLAYGQDKIILLRKTATCRDHDRDPSVGPWDSWGITVSSDAMAYFAPTDVPFGGMWKMCYCSLHDSVLDNDTATCSSYADFPSLVGYLTITGAYPGQDFRCTRNEACKINLRGFGLQKDIHEIAVRDSSVACSDSTSVDEATRRRRDFTGNPYAASERISDEEIQFVVEPIQALDTFYICVCVPPPASGMCQGATLQSYDQYVGTLDVRGAAANQEFSCGRGGHCTLNIQGRGLSTKDYAKIVNMTTECFGPVVTAGFFISLVPAAPSETTSTLAVFKLGRVTAPGSFKICYCANLQGCDNHDKFNHVAGILHLQDPLEGVSLKSATAASIYVLVNSRVSSAGSVIRCAVAEYEPRTMPTAADVTNGLGTFGLGFGQAYAETLVGDNEVEVHFKNFVRAGQQYRIWCFDTSAASFILPGNVGGELIIMPESIATPQVTVSPGFLWTGAEFDLELSGVYHEAVLPSNRRLSAHSRRLEQTLVRVTTGASAPYCNRAKYKDATSMSVFAAGEAGKSNTVLLTQTKLTASAFRRFVCFWSGPNATGIAIEGEELTIQTDQPTYTQKTMDGQTLIKFYRGVFMQAVFQHQADTKGLIHWVSRQVHDQTGCSTASRLPPAAQVLSGPNTSFFRIDDPPGEYMMCYLGKETESSSSASFNSVGLFELLDIVTQIKQDPAHPSTRNTIRLQLEIRMLGTLVCIARLAAAAVSPSDFNPSVNSQGRAALQVPPPEDGVDPEFPRMFTLSVPLTQYQKGVGPLHVWCHHSQAELLVFPGDATGKLIMLQTAEPYALPDPDYLWNGTFFKLTLFNTPTIKGKYLAVYQPALPDGWESHIVIEGGVRKLKYNLVGRTENQDEHPVYKAYADGTGPDPCQGSDVRHAVRITEQDYTQTKDYIQANILAPFVCYWASQSSFPHLISVLDILAQSPEFSIEIAGQTSSFVYRGVDATFRIKHTSQSGGRILVVKRSIFNGFGGACQDMGFPPISGRRLQRVDADSWSSMLESQWDHESAERYRRLQTSSTCVSSPQRTSQLKLIPETEIFPTPQWGVDMPPGLNCSRDFRLYWNPALANTAVMANQGDGKYFMVTSNVSVLQHFIKIRLLTGGSVPNSSIAVVEQSFDKDNLANLSSQSWVLNANDCSARVLLSIASPMQEEGAETLSPSTFLELENFFLFAIVYMPNADNVMNKNLVCMALQPPAAQPPRQESLFDIDQLGLGRTIQNGLVWVPSYQNDTGSFLHNEQLSLYVLCYIGDETVEEPRMFNPFGAVFESKDVLPLKYFEVPDEPQSNTLQAHINMTSKVRGQVRCLALLRSTNPPTLPSHIFAPDMQADDFLGSSNLIQYDIADTKQLVTIFIHPTQAKFITPSQAFARAPPTMYVFCAHKGSTIVYPNDGIGFLLDLKARPPPSMVYRQLNQTVTYVELTLALAFSPIVVRFSDPAFPVNSYDEVKFSTRPAMPKGLEIDISTGAISGTPEKSGEFKRTIVASSVNPPGESSIVDITLSIDDVLGLSSRFVNVESALFSIVARITRSYRPDEFVLLTKLKVHPFSNQPSEFFCLGDLRSNRVARTNESFVKCRSENDACCCSGYVLHHLKVQDIRITTADCTLTLTKKYHTRGMAVGMLSQDDGSQQQTALASGVTADFLMPEEYLPDKKAPVLFDLVIDIAWEDYSGNEDMVDEQLKSELASVVAIPQKLVEIRSAEEVTLFNGTRVRFDINFNVEPRCVEQLTMEMEFLSFGIDTREGCNRIAPEEYMLELKEQLSLEDSMIYSNPDLIYLRRVVWSQSFKVQKVMFFCAKEPIWEYAAVVETEEECPFDPVKLFCVAVIALTIGGSILFGIFCHISYNFAACAFLHRVRVLDIMTSLLAMYTIIGDYGYLLILNSSEAYGMPKETFFIAALAHLFLSFCINALALNITIRHHISDTPWWRRNKRQMKSILFLSTLAPRFFRITRAQISGIDRTQIHFGTPSKMAVTFSNLGLVMVFQDLLQCLLQTYIWNVWGNEGPKIQLICMFLGVQSILVAISHHVFSRSQRAAYERVVKLLGVRRLTAGFFDVSAAAHAGHENRGGHNAISLRKAGGGTQMIELNDDEDENQGPMDPTKLDPIAAALYVSQMYEKETVGAKRLHKALDESDSDSAGSESGESDDSMQLYPKPLYDKMKKFYSTHDPAKLSKIGIGNTPVDEDKLDRELKRSFGVGLASVE